MIIGVAGTNASGKDSMAEYLVGKGFIHYSHSDVLREDLSKQGVEITRDALINYGNKLRAEHGPDILTRRLREKLVDGRNYVITSIRNAAEVAAWQELEDFTLVWVDAPVNIRFERFSSRQERSSESRDEQTLESFMSAEQREWENDDPNKQQLKKCKELASETIINDLTIDIFHRKIDNIIKGVKR